MHNITSNKEKYHFFIGNILDNEEQVRMLKNIQKKLVKKYRLKEYHWNNKLYANFIYLGYMDSNTASLYMDNMMSNLLGAISEQFHKLTCKYTNYKIESDKSFHKVSLKLIDTENKIINIIVQYLHKYGILPIYPNRKDILKPAVDLVYYKNSSIIGDDKEAIRIQVPSMEFTIDHLSLIKGTPIKVRSGAPSLHDQMHYEEVHKYTFPLLD